MQEGQRISRCDEEVGYEGATCISWTDKDTQKDGSNWRRRGDYLLFYSPLSMEY
jgi:hypothetical protein